MAFFGKILIDKGKEGACLHLPLEDSRSLDEDTQSADALHANDPFAFPDSPVKTTPSLHPPASTKAEVQPAVMQPSLADPLHQMVPQSDEDTDKIQALGVCRFSCVPVLCNCFAAVVKYMQRYVPCI